MRIVAKFGQKYFNHGYCWKSQKNIPDYAQTKIKIKKYYQLLTKKDTVSPGSIK